MRGALIGLLLVAATIAVFAQTIEFDFVLFDDDRYLIENEHIQGELSLEQIRWAFTTGDVSNWHPLTWISYMLDHQVFGLDPSGYHATNLLFHGLNTLLLFVVLGSLTRETWPSAAVAALFAVHPLHVESVAWISERKDVLSAFFALLSIYAYAAYARRGGLVRYTFAAGALALGLLAKPMLVTLPFVFLLLDYWPLRRMRIALPIDAEGSDSSAHAVLARCPRRPLARLVIEKAPLFAMCAGSSVATYLAQKSGGTVASAELIPVHLRLANAAHAYVWYVAKTVWPARLSVHYPHPFLPAVGGERLSVWGIIGALVFLVAMTLLLLRATRRPYAIVGWLWFLGMMVPVIGLVQVGTQGMADRYTYLPLIGPFVAVCWGARDLVTPLRRRPGWTLAIPTIGTAVLVACAVTSWIQTRHWRDSISLFEHALEVTPRNAVISRNLGNALQSEGRIEEAIGHYRRSLDIYPNYGLTHLKLGQAYVSLHLLDDAERHFRYAVQLKPDLAEAHVNLASTLLLQKKLDAAIAHYRRAVELAPRNASMYLLVGNALQARGELDAAIASYGAAVELDPESALAHTHLANALRARGELDAAIVHYRLAAAARPDDARVQRNLANALRARRESR